MAKLRLGRYEAEEGQLPPVCLRCGEPAGLFKMKQFSWHPLWSYVLLVVVFWPLILVSLILRRRMRVFIPLCDAHRHFWIRRSLIMMIGFAALLVVVLLVADALAKAVLRDRIVSLALLFWLIGPSWLVAMLSLRARSIRPIEITDDAITLIGVSERFIEAFRAERKAGPIHSSKVEVTNGARRQPQSAGQRSRDENAPKSNTPRRGP